LERYKAQYNLVEVQPKTGRTHQIRVHLAALGAPIVGDSLYGDGRGFMLSDVKRNFKKRGDEQPLIGRLALLARSLLITHPESGEPLLIEAPLPREMDIAIHHLRRYPASGWGPVPENE
jgi:23S rRNA-/tRNA-specific pseudouridylate synthase